MLYISLTKFHLNDNGMQKDYKTFEVTDRSLIDSLEEGDLGIRQEVNL